MFFEWLFWCLRYSFSWYHLFQISNSFVSTELTSQIDQKITELVAEQQKIDAERAHDKSEMEQLKQDIANANKQKQLISKALAKKVLLDF